MSSFFDIVISFVAALIAAAFAHFGASEIPASRATPASVPEASVPQEAPALSAPPAAPAEPAMTPVSAPQPPAPPQPENVMETTVLEAEHMAAMAAHDAQMRAHEAQMRAYEAISEATEKARPNAGIMSHLTLHPEVRPVSALSPRDQMALDTAVASHIEVMVSVATEAQSSDCKVPETLIAPGLTADAGTRISLSL